MADMNTHETMMNLDNTSFLDALHQQDAALEQIELILYNILQLAEQSASDSCSLELRQQLQEKIDFLLVEIDDISKSASLPTPQHLSSANL